MTTELFEAVRTAASAATWSRGVELCRADAVAEESAGDDEILLRVAHRGGLVTPTVILYPADAEWDCDCGTQEDACADREEYEGHRARRDAQRRRDRLWMG